MNDKIKSTMERLRKKLPIYDPYVAMAYTQDMMDIAAEFLLEHPEDDETPIDDEWLLITGFSRFMQSASCNHMCFGKLTRWSNKEGIHWTFGMEPIPAPQTRSELRRLGSCLGIKLP